MDTQLFVKACDEIIGQQQGLNGIGTLGEKTVHSVLKCYLSPEQRNREVKIGGFVADICTGGEIIEIQTRGFDRLRRKLSAFLAIAPVTVVYPIHNTKWIRWVNPQTGEITPPRKSPKSGSPYTIFPELYKIKNYLTDPNLSFKIIMMDLEEYRILDGWSGDKKKGSTKSDRIPTQLVRELTVGGKEGYESLIPDTLAKEFTARDYKTASGAPLKVSRVALHVLNYVGAVERVGKKGNTFIYRKNGGNNDE